MDAKIYKITYDTNGGSGSITLCSGQEGFDKLLAEVEQTLADTEATNIVYNICDSPSSDLTVDVSEGTQLGFDTKEK